MCPAGIHVAILYQFLPGITLPACNPVGGEICIKKCSGKKKGNGSSFFMPYMPKHFVNMQLVINWYLFFFSFNLLAVIYTRGWIQSPSEGGLNSFLVTPQLQRGTAGKTTEAERTLEEALREHQ